MFSFRDAVELPLALVVCAGVAFVFALRLGVSVGVLATAAVLATMIVSLSWNAALAPRRPGVREVTSGPIHEHLRALAEHARVHTPRLYLSARLSGPYAVTGAGPNDTVILVHECATGSQVRAVLAVGVILSAGRSLMLMTLRDGTFGIACGCALALAVENRPWFAAAAPVLALTGGALAGAHRRTLAERARVLDERVASPHMGPLLSDPTA
ncbi:MAG: hypothetical protein ACLP01_01445 [Solirubrobacteraceae bacterium]